MNNNKFLLLHGAIGAADQLQPLACLLESEYDVYTLNFSGHGGRAGSNDFSIAHFAEDVLHFLDEQGLKSVHIFGYSMGGYVALYLAKHYPDRVNRIITLGTKFHWDEETAEAEIKNLQPEIIEQKIPRFAAALMKRHEPGDWKQVLFNTANMMLAMGKKNPLSLKDYKSIEHEVLITIGDHDQMVSLEETVAVFRQLKNGKLFVIPDTQHPIEKVNLQRIHDEIVAFTGVPQSPAS